MREIVERVRQRTSIPIYERKVENILSALCTSNDPWKIADLSEEPFPLVMAVINVLSEKGYVKLNEGIELTKKGKELLKEFRITSKKDFTCKHCKGKTVDLDEFKDLLRRFTEIAKDRPEPKHEFDQAYVTPETTVARVVFMHSRGDVENKEIFVLGDDDLTSVALMLSKLPKKISVLDIDSRLTRFIERVAEKLGCTNVEILTFDLRKPLPEEFSKKFDTFITDPPETIDAIRAFIGRGIAMLKGPGCAGYFGLTKMESSVDKWQKIQRILIEEFQVVITDIIRNFNEYVNWDYIQQTRGWKLVPVKSVPEYNWYKSYFFRIQTVESSKGYKEEVTANQELYDDDESSTT
ncbi:bis-aminopropyl spermidine synthase family protein [Pseudothermotoga thermarum]|uniref:N(4)-bis(aminopropyl)spermidine synthase n=1 Tax=Pseudothermotoga thermarum DSM 5069 TaxID=688269 RepID=F7YTY4_9THEM|nr:bis-aminopropyl spermidine synthase family protein [Pseudothermotoga thermarum]AEH51566.1 protein of unknown function DUF43 [Pseudothermotoga thermarum DSM 5069]